jgi:hypothetical protein
VGITKRTFARVVALTVIVVLALAGLAAAASNGTYTGKSSQNGKRYPFGLKVSGGKIVALAGAASAKCGIVYATKKDPFALSVPIRHNSFSASIPITKGPAKGSVLTLSGSFKGSTVSGSFGGSLVESGKKCSIPKSSFHGSR